MPAIFLSYRRGDSAGYAGRLRDSLQRRLGHGQVFQDVDGIGPGQDFVAAIDVRLRECRTLLALIGREWLDAADASHSRRLDQENDYVRLEIAAALARPGVLVVPVLVEGMTMPRAEDLPPTIRGLARHQAVSLRDETWDADVDRLVAALIQTGPRGLARGARWVALAVAALAVVVVVRSFWLSDRHAVADLGSRPGTASPVTPAPGEGAASVPSAPASAIAIPRVVEIVHDHVIYTLLSGSIAPRGGNTTVALRVRLSNDGPYPTNFGDGAFRLAVGNEVLVPSGELNEIVAGHSLRQGVTRFAVPAGAKQAVFRVLLGDSTAEVPLTLVSTGHPGETDRPDAGDALSHAIVGDVAREPRPLATGAEGGYTMTKAIARRFVNAVRIRFSVRLANRSPYPMVFGTDAFRLLVEGQTLAPVDGPNQAVASHSDASADVVFDVPTSARAVVLRTTDRGSTADVPFELPAVTR